MTEQEWLASEDPAAMLSYFLARAGHVPGKEAFTDRKLRLFACACARQVWHLLTDDAPCGVCGGAGEIGSLAGKVACYACSRSPLERGTGRVNRRVNRSRRAVEVAERFADGEATEHELASCRGPAGESVPGAWLANAAARDAANCAVFGVVHSSRFGVVHSSRGVLPLPPATQAALLRCVVGDPFRPVTIKGPRFIPHVRRMDYSRAELWLTPTVVSLAQAAYEERTGRECEACKGRGGCCSLKDAEDQSWRDAHTCGACGGTGRIDDGSIDPLNLSVLADALEEAGCSDDALLSHLRSPGPHVRGCWAVDLCLGRS